MHGHKMVNKRVKVHLENTVCLIAHVPKTGLDWTSPLPMVPKCFGTHLSRRCLFDGHEEKEELIRLFGGGGACSLLKLGVPVANRLFIVRRGI